MSAGIAHRFVLPHNFTPELYSSPSDDIGATVSQDALTF